MRIYGTGKIIEEVISLIVFPCIKVRSDPYCCDVLLNPILFYYNNLLFSPEPPDPPPLTGNFPKYVPTFVFWFVLTIL